MVAWREERREELIIGRLPSFPRMLSSSYPLLLPSPSPSPDRNLGRSSLLTGLSWSWYREYELTTASLTSKKTTGEVGL